MYDWIISPTGGDVPSDQVALILSSRFPPPLTPNRAEPTTQTIDEAFEDLQVLAEHNGQLGNGRRTGRRLYTYFSGHGCAPRLLNDSALLTANASALSPGHHVLGRLSAEWFLRANFFDETVLFMDCCRENVDVGPRIPPYIDVTGAEAMDRAHAFYGFGTKWSRLSRERVMTDGAVHGVFTWALLQSLKTAADPATGEVTAQTLGDYLYNNMKAFLRPDDLADPDVPKEPDLDYDRNPQNRFVFCAKPVAAQRPVAELPVTVRLPPEAAGHQVAILDAKFSQVRAAPAIPPTWQVQLPPGSYIVQILTLGRQSPPFDVTPTGAVDVVL